jgi:hypothetical protein
MQITSRFALPLLACALLGGCAGVSPTRIIGNTVGVAGGALLGSKISKNNPFAATAGAGAGLLLSESLHAGSTAAANKSYAAGYEKGRSDSAKQQYHTLIEQQRQPAGGTDEPATLFDIPLPEREVGGAILKPSTRTLRIQE